MSGSQKKKETPLDFSIQKIGKSSIPSPLSYSKTHGDSVANYVPDDASILRLKASHQFDPGKPLQFTGANSLEKAGPREQIYFNPEHIHAGIVTCGGLCPGLNDVVRSIVRTLWYQYNVRRITGISYGYKGFHAEFGHAIKELSPDIVDDIHQLGGSYLGSARGGSDVARIVDSMERLNLNILFPIGGDGTQRCALEIAEEIEKRKLKMAVVGIPKTIDNDLSYIGKSFGFDTAVARASEVVKGAHEEAKSAYNGIGLVKLMGRESGFITAYTALASNDANFILIPEVPFDLDGPNGFLSHLKARLRRSHHAMIIIAEGAGQQHYSETDVNFNEWGHKQLHDIGIFLKDTILRYFQKEKMEISMKYIDPSYIIRASVANPADSIYCARLGSNAVHAAMSGRTGMLVGECNGSMVHVPTQMAVSKRNTVDPESSFWRDVLEATRQPISMMNTPE